MVAIIGLVGTYPWQSELSKVDTYNWGHYSGLSLAAATTVAAPLVGLRPLACGLNASALYSLHGKDTLDVKHKLGRLYGLIESAQRHAQQPTVEESRGECSTEA
jgi:hypothetical protein